MVAELSFMATPCQPPCPPGHDEAIAELQRRIDAAAAILQAAPDLIGNEASKRQAREVATANRVAWAILTQGRYPDSVRHQQNEAADGK